MQKILIFFIITTHIGFLRAQSYTKWVTGDPADFVSTSYQGGAVLAGGGPDNDQAMAWMLQRAGGGDVVVLRASGSNGYNNYFFSQLGVSVHSVETIRFNDATAAFDPYVVQQIRNAEVLFIVGGDQYVYYQYWKDTPVEAAINYLIHEKGVTVGGTSAGMAILGKAYYAPPGASLTSSVALANPYHPNADILGKDDFIDMPFMDNLVTDTHYDQRDRQGRHVVFMSRLAQDHGVRPFGIACNEATAVCIDHQGIARVFGEHPAYDDYAYFLKGNCQIPFGPETCQPGQPLTWYRKQSAVKAYRIPGTVTGNNYLDLKDWETGQGGEWQDWYVESGVLKKNFNTDASCGAGEIAYTPSDEDFVNPERGFMRFTETFASAHTPLDPVEMATWRNLHQPWLASYAIKASLVYRSVYLDLFKNSPVSDDFLQAIQQDFDAVRQAGMKLVLRFAYTQKTSPPFGDAPKEIVLLHIAQLEPLLRANADVIAVLQMGFIGAWGEGYYTDHFGFGNLSPENWADRSEVLHALLAALPKDRSVQVRVPQLKQKALYGTSAPISSPPMPLDDAWTDKPQARIGFFNDCFLSSFTDTGTFLNYDIGASGCDTCLLKPYFAAESRFVPVGGETCADWNPYSDCVEQPGGHAQHEMARMHYSYLNADWNTEVNNDWADGGCIEEIKKRLGYRIELQEGIFSPKAQPGQSIHIKISLLNKGFAAPFNPRRAKLLLRNVVNSDIWAVELPENPRKWLSHAQPVVIEHTLCLPTNMPLGKYELLLHLADPYPHLAPRPEYALRLANQGVWEPATGFNKLLHEINLTNEAENPVCNGELCFQPLLLDVPSGYFTASAQIGCAPMTVQFFSQNSNCWAHEWYFPGGEPESSTEISPVVVYPEAGMYPVQLSVTNASGTGASAQPNFIHVETLPSPSFEPHIDGLTVVFENTSTPGSTTWEWDFGDGSPWSNDFNPMYTYAAHGTYTVTLRAQNLCGEAVAAKEIIVQQGTNTHHIAETNSAYIFPNPSHGYVWLGWSGPEDVWATVTMTNALGQQALQTHTYLQRGKPVQLLQNGELPPGVYFAEVKTPAHRSLVWCVIKMK